MTVMTKAEARREKARRAVSDLVPDPIAEAQVMMEDLALPEEFEANGFESTHEVAEHIEEEVVKTIEATNIGRDGQEFVEEAAEEAREEVYDLVMAEFEEYAAGSGLDI